MAKQRITPGGTIDVATPGELASMIAQAMSNQAITEYRREKGIINLDANGAGATKIADLVVSSQYDLLLERITIGGAGAVNALVGVYENQVSDTDLLEIIQLGTVGKYSDAFSNVIYVTANSAPIIAVTGGVPNGQVTYNLQAHLKRHPPRA